MVPLKKKGFDDLVTTGFSQAASRNLISPSRRFILAPLRITCRTETAIALSGLMPIDLKAKAKHELAQAKASGLYNGQQVENEQHRRSMPRSTWAFTDGSKLPEGVGYGVAIYSNESWKPIHSTSGKLDHCSVYQAELTAIKTALKLYIDSDTSDLSILISTDSLSSLQSIENKDRQYEIAAEIKDLTAELQTSFRCKVFYRWVCAHSGVKGNEEADKLAKSGSERDEFDQHLPTPLSAAAYEIKQLLWQGWKPST